MAKKKPKKRKPRSPGAGPDPQQRQERLEARRQAKAAAEAARRRKERRDRLIRNLALLALAGGVVWFFFFRGGGGDIPDSIAGHPIQDFSTTGANQHTEGTVEYESTPPVSGEHAASTAECGVHATAIQNELQVHTLEHGAVGIQYEPDLAPEDIEKIEAIVRDFDSHVFSAPYEQPMETPIAVTAWGYLMTLEEFDGPAIREFIDVFRQNGDAPEATNDCPNAADDSFVPPTASPSPSPEATETPDGEDKDGKGKKGDKGDKGEGSGDDK